VLEISNMPPANHLRIRLHNLYRHIDARARELAEIHTGRLHCRLGCCDCCVDDLTVNSIEAENIRYSFSELLATGTPYPAGACAFLDRKGLCRIYDARPYVCRTQGLPLHWIAELDDGTVAAMRDICPKNDTGIPVEELAENNCWTIGPVEEELARLQFEGFVDQMIRIELRRLFSGT
jgi:uncharacterized protein